MEREMIEAMIIVSHDLQSTNPSGANLDTRIENSFKNFQKPLHFSCKMSDNELETISSTMRMFPNTGEYISKKCRRPYARTG